MSRCRKWQAKPKTGTATGAPGRATEHVPRSGPRKIRVNISSGPGKTRNTLLQREARYGARTAAPVPVGGGWVGGGVGAPWYDHVREPGTRRDRAGAPGLG